MIKDKVSVAVREYLSANAPNIDMDKRMEIEHITRIVLSIINKKK